MASSREKSEYVRGVVDGLPFVLVVAPFAVVFGVVATEAGLSFGQAMGFSVLVVAGASQMAALQLITENAPFLVIVATALAVNLRMAMYSAALQPHLGAAPLWQRAVVAYLNVDQTFAQSVAAYEARPGMTLAGKLGYFFGVASPVFPVWYAGTVAGTLAGRQVPDWLALDFAVPITFLAIAAPMLKTLAHVAAAFTSAVLALLLAGLPYGTGLLAAGLAAMAVGAAVETATGRRT